MNSATSFRQETKGRSKRPPQAGRPRSMKAAQDWGSLVLNLVQRIDDRLVALPHTVAEPVAAQELLVHLVGSADPIGRGGTPAASCSTMVRKGGGNGG